MWCNNVGMSFFRFVTQSTHLTDRQTDGRTDRKVLQLCALYYMQLQGNNADHETEIQNVCHT